MILILEEDILVLGGGASPPPPPLPGQAPSAEQILRRCYDNSKQALLVEDAGSPSGLHATRLSWRQVLMQAYNPTTGRIRVVFVSLSGASGDRGRDFTQCIQKSFDPTVKALRLVTGLAPKTLSSRMLGEYLWKFCWSLNNFAFRAENSGASSGSLGTKLDYNQVLARVVNTTTGNIRYVL